MSTEMLKQVGRRAFEEMWNQGNLSLIDEIYAPDGVMHDIAGDFVGRDAYRQFVTLYRTAYPDIHFTVDDQIAEGNLAVARWSSTGTHKGELMGIPPTGKRTVSGGIVLSRFEGKQIVEEWSYWDALGILQQLGVVPAMGRTNFTWSEPSDVTGDPGDPEINKAVIRRYDAEVWGRGKLDVLDEIMSSEVIGHEVTTEHLLPQGLEGHKQAITIYRTAFPDIHTRIEELIAEGDRVAERWRATGTHKGELMGIPPTQKEVTWEGMTIYRFADGKIVEMWWAWDALGLLRQLGVVPQ